VRRKEKKSDNDNEKAKANKRQGAAVRMQLVSSGRKARDSAKV